MNTPGAARADRADVDGVGAAPVTLTVDGRTLQARPGETLIELADRCGIAIPRLCHKPGLAPAGNCRACVVELQGERPLAAACCRRAEPGMVVDTVGERTRNAQRLVLEMLLADLPHHHAGAPALQADDELRRWADALGVRAVPAPRLGQRAALPVDASHPAITVRLDACIQCTRCVRACRDEQVNGVIGLAFRGSRAQIVFDQGDALGASTCVACGECVQACPTGALAVAPQRARFAAQADPAAAAAGPAQAGAPAVAADAAADDSAVADPAPVRATVARPVVAERAVDSLCPFCGVGCQLRYHVAGQGSGAAIVRVDGRAGPANAGRLCVKGRFGFDYARHPQRLTHPLVRRDGVPKDAQQLVRPEDWAQVFREASWEEALTRAAQGFLDIRDAHGGDALAGFGSAKGSNEEAYLFQKLVRLGLKSPHVDHCTRLCHASSVAALLEGLGSAAVSNPVRDVLQAEVVLIVGANPTVNHPVAASWIKNAQRQGTKLVVLDPRRSELAQLADHHLAFRPGSDVALLSAMLHVIDREGLADRDFIAARTEGYEAFSASLAHATPEAMAPLCDVPAERIRAVARLYARSRTAMILWGMGISQHAHGTDNARCLIALALLTGHIGRPGTGLHPLRGQNNVQGASDAGLIPMMYPDYQRVTDPAVRARVAAHWGVPEAALRLTPGLTVVELMHAANAGRLKGLMVMGENPAMSDPDLAHARAGLAALEHLVVQDIFLTETAALADVVLPASAFAEKTGSFTNTDRCVQIGRRALPPPGLARTDLAILLDLAGRLGMAVDAYGAADDHTPDHGEAAVAAVFEEMRGLMPSIAGIGWARLQREGAVTYPCQAEDQPGEAVVFTDHFPTASGRGRFVPVSPGGPAELPDDDYPMVLITGRKLEHWHTGSMTRRSQVLDALEPEPVALMHPQDLAAMGVTAGAALTLHTRRGAIALWARADEGTPPGAVFVAFCWAEAAANRLTQPTLDPVAKIPEFKHCAVRVEPGGRPPAAPGYGGLTTSLSQG
jgi:formate dehydrogenase major subunit